MPTKKVNCIAGKFITVHLATGYNVIVIQSANGLIDIKDEGNKVTEGLFESQGHIWAKTNPKGVIYVRGSLTEQIKIFYGKDDRLYNAATKGGTVALPKVAAL